MLKLKTESGAEYLIRADEEGAREVHRVGPRNAGIPIADGEWSPLVSMFDVEIGSPAYFSMELGTFILTTPVLTIEEVE